MKYLEAGISPPGREVWEMKIKDAFFPLNFACADPAFLWDKVYMELKRIKVQRLTSGSLNPVREF